MLWVFNNGGRKIREVILILWDRLVCLWSDCNGQVIILLCDGKSFVNSGFAYENRRFGFRILEIVPGSNDLLSPINISCNCPQCIFFISSFY